jgi:hypothetical protein
MEALLGAIAKEVQSRVTSGLNLVRSEREKGREREREREERERRKGQ